MDNGPWLKFDIEKTSELIQVYESTIDFILEDLPKINWNSPKQIVAMLEKELGVSVRNAKIQTIASCIDEADDRYEMIQGIVYFLKLKFCIKNYLNPIIKADGLITLRKEGSVYLMPNKQPLPYSGEVWDCLIEVCDELRQCLPPNQRPQTAITKE